MNSLLELHLLGWLLARGVSISVGGSVTQWWGQEGGGQMLGGLQEALGVADSARLGLHHREVRGGREHKGLLGPTLVAGTSSLLVVLLAVEVPELVAVTGLFARQLGAAAIQHIGGLFGHLSRGMMEPDRQGWGVHVLQNLAMRGVHWALGQERRRVALIQNTSGVGGQCTLQGEGATTGQTGLLHRGRLQKGMTQVEDVLNLQALGCVKHDLDVVLVEVEV